MTLSALHFAVWNPERSLDYIKKLLVDGADVNATRNGLHKTPLHFILQHSHPQHRNRSIAVVKLLLRHGADANIRDFIGDSALHNAISRSFGANVIKMLITNGADVNAVGACNAPPLHLALGYECEAEVINILLNHGANMDEYTLLRAVRYHYNYDVIKIMLKKGAVIEGHAVFGRNIVGYSPLTQAAINHQRNSTRESMECVKLLMQYTFLQSLDLNDISSLIECCLNHSLFRFVTHCKAELDQMNSEFIADSVTLREFLCRQRWVKLGKILNTSQEIETTEDEINQILRILKSNKYPLYYDVILGEIANLPTMLSKVQMPLIHTVIYSDQDCNERKISLNYDTVCCIVDYLSNEELLNVAVAFYTGDSPNQTLSSSASNSNHNNFLRKRSLSKYHKNVKRLRFGKEF